MTAPERTTVGYISKRNGAWLVSLTSAEGMDSPADETYDCASSQTIARRVLRELAEDFDISGPWRWVDAGGGTLWWLEGYEPEWERAAFDSDLPNSIDHTGSGSGQ